LPLLITKYHDGYIAQDLDTPNLKMKKLFYPKWWLDLTGFWKNPPVTGPDVILFQPAPADNPVFTTSALVKAVAWSALVSCAVTLLVGAYLFRHRERTIKLSGALGVRRAEYIEIRNV
jgi:hypothetical protein